GRIWRMTAPPCRPVAPVTNTSFSELLTAFSFGVGRWSQTNYFSRAKTELSGGLTYRAARETCGEERDWSWAILAASCEPAGLYQKEAEQRSQCDMDDHARSNRHPGAKRHRAKNNSQRGYLHDEISGQHGCEPLFSALRASQLIVPSPISVAPCA